MEKEKLQEFTLRITQSNRTQLVVVIYDIILACVEEAEECGKNEDWNRFQETLDKAGSFVKELVGALDFQYEISAQLASLYFYVNRCLVQARRKKDAAELKGVKAVIGGLRDSFEKISETDTSAPLMKNTQAVYEGFTYGRDSRNEVYQPSGSNRGYTI